MHPFSEHRQSKVERSRIASLTKGYATGGAVSPGGTGAAPVTKRAAGGTVSGKIEGRATGGRLDKYARGGKVKGSTNVNVIIAPQGGGAGAVPPPVAPPMLGAGPPMPMPPPGAGGPPPMPQRRGGRAYATGGAVKDGPAWREGLRNGTQVQNTPGKSDTGDIYRSRQITYATGGPVEAGPMGPRMNAGAYTAKGRLEKTALQKRKR